MLTGIYRQRIKHTNAGVNLMKGRAWIKTGIGTASAKDRDEKLCHLPWTGNLEEDTAIIKGLLGEALDLRLRMIEWQGGKAIFCFLTGLTDVDLLEEHAIKPLLDWQQTVADKKGDKVELVKNSLLAIANCLVCDNWELGITGLLNGNTLLLLEGSCQHLLLAVPGWQERTVEQPIMEAVVNGPRDGFVENLEANLATIRRHCRDPLLRIEGELLGFKGRKLLALVYIQGTAPPYLYREVKRRLQRIRRDNFLDTGMLEDYLADNIYSPFPTVQRTERPDRLVAALLEGRIALLLDGSPMALIVPACLHHFLVSPDDSYTFWLAASFFRLVRMIATFLAVFLPALYIAVTTFHPGMLPGKLLIALAAGREGMPFPTIIEALLMEFSIELVREAGIRLPQPIGQTVGMVGGLVLGEAAIRAGIATPGMVITVALTAIASFIVPTYHVGYAFRMLRFLFLLAAAFFGLYGLVLAFLFLLGHLLRLKSFAVSYLTPYVPARPWNWGDSLWRLPYQWLGPRAEYLRPELRSQGGEGE